MDKIQEIQDALLTPLTKNHCLYFYLLMLFSLVALILNIVALLSVTVMGKKRKHLLRHAMMTLLPGAVLYYQNRLFYSMCVN